MTSSSFDVQRGRWQTFISSKKLLCDFRKKNWGQARLARNVKVVLSKALSLSLSIGGNRRIRKREHWPQPSWLMALRLKQYEHGAEHSAAWLLNTSPPPKKNIEIQTRHTLVVYFPLPLVLKDVCVLYWRYVGIDFKIPNIRFAELPKLPTSYYLYCPSCHIIYDTIFLPQLRCNYNWLFCPTVYSLSC